MIIFDTRTIYFLDFVLIYVFIFLRTKVRIDLLFPLLKTENLYRSKVVL